LNIVENKALWILTITEVHRFNVVFHLFLYNFKEECMYMQYAGPACMLPVIEATNFSNYQLSVAAATTYQLVLGGI